MRVKNGPAHHRRRNKVLKRASGFYGRRKSSYRVARIAVRHALMDGFKDRRRKKRDMRGLWIVRLGAAARAAGLSYSRFVHLLKGKSVLLNRKMLANIAAREPGVFEKLTQLVR